MRQDRVPADTSGYAEIHSDLGHKPGYILGSIAHAGSGFTLTAGAAQALAGLGVAVTPVDAATFDANTSIVANRGAAQSGRAGASSLDGRDLCRPGAGDHVRR